MSGAASIEDAAGGVLPAWAVAGPARRAHMARVAALLEEWATALGLGSRERMRWRAAAWLHDALRDAPPGTLIDCVRPEFKDWPGPLLHGPAAAERLREDGVDDADLLLAVAYHTVGHAELDCLGQALYLADFLEPGRTFEPVRRAALRARLPAAIPQVLADVVSDRMTHLILSGRRLRPETVSFWNTLQRE